VGAEKKMTSIGKPVPELPVADVERAQQHYRDVLGFEIGWLYPDKGIGAVSRGDVGPIFFRKRTPPFEPAVHWVFAEDIDASYEELKSVRSEHHRPSGTEALGIAAVHRKRSGRKSFLFPP
jgi:catechol 2,3-dioxygenase-like lactoylglutathione lyase family enzyme